MKGNKQYIQSVKLFTLRPLMRKQSEIGRTRDRLFAQLMHVCIDS